MEPRPSTFSIVARDPETEAVGVAVQSKFVSVGSVVPFASADAGAIATQSFANVAYGPDGLDMLREGKSAEEVVRALTEEDPESAQRQVGVVGQDGSVAAFTGEECFEYAGDRQGENYTVQGNILENEATVEAMAEVMKTSDDPLPETLIAALHAANEAGGDSRGEQSAALYVVKPDGGYDGKNDRWIDVRVDDHESPIDELERAFKIYDVTLLEREEPDDVRELSGETAEQVAETLAEMGFYDSEARSASDASSAERSSADSRAAEPRDDGETASDPSPEFGEDERDALEAFRGMNNFENHDLAVVEDALARGWSESAGEGEARMVDAIWHGLSRLDRK